MTTVPLMRNAKIKAQIAAVVLPLLSLLFYGDTWVMRQKDTEAQVVNRQRWGRLKTLEKYDDFDRAIFSSGSFWHLQAAFEGAAGVVESMAGYAGGTVAHPNFFTAPFTGHADMVIVYYNRSLVRFPAVLATFLANTDPFDAGGQFCDRGKAYRSSVHTTTREQAEVARLAVQHLRDAAGPGVHITVEDVTKQAEEESDDFLADSRFFYPAEERHQYMHHRSPVKFAELVKACNVKQRLDAILPAVSPTLRYLKEHRFQTDELLVGSGGGGGGSAISN